MSPQQKTGTICSSYKQDTIIHTLTDVNDIKQHRPTKCSNISNLSVTYQTAASEKGLSYPYVVTVNCIKKIRETTLLEQSPVARRRKAF
jgi:beta-galactosidase GanA